MSTTPNLNSIGQLVQRLAESQPQQWCLIAPNGTCYLGPDPLVLGAQATNAQQFQKLLGKDSEHD